MPRMGRIILPSYPHHVMQRGHNRQVVFAGERDFLRYLEDLRELKSLFDIRVYAYCLITNHVHLVLAPGEAVATMGQMMKAMAARATRHRNKLEGRTGTLWESRYRSSPIQTDGYLLACIRYVELNPVRACMVREPQEYRWSSYQQRMGMSSDVWVDVDPCYHGLGVTEEARRHSYGQFVRKAAPDGEVQLIREALQRGQLTGNQRFVDEVEGILGRRVELRGQGRPVRAALTGK